MRVYSKNLVAQVDVEISSAAWEIIDAEMCDTNRGLGQDAVWRLDWQAGELELLQDFCEDLQNGFGGAFQCERLALRVIEQSQVQLLFRSKFFAEGVEQVPFLEAIGFA